MQRDQERTTQREERDMEQVRDESRDVEHGSMSTEELDQQQASDLPDRDAMSLVNLNAAVPINAAIAANVLSDNSSALAGAIQDTPIDQST
jgi:hypothetical protein